MTIDEAAFQRERDLAAAWAKAEDKVKALELQIGALKEEVADVRDNKEQAIKAWALAADERDRFSGELQAANRLNGELKAALHKIACAECTVHDEHCEIRKFSGSHDCACDPRVAGAAIPGYPCPVLTKTEKRNHENG